LLPARLPGDETVVINTGFVPNSMQDRGWQDRSEPAISIDPVALLGTLEMLKNASPNFSTSRDSTPYPVRDN
jgi:cytochrome oxidase assembly protein ShyY1